MSAQAGFIINEAILASSHPHDEAFMLSRRSSSNFDASALFKRSYKRWLFVSRSFFAILGQRQSQASPAHLHQSHVVSSAFLPPVRNKLQSRCRVILVASRQVSRMSSLPMLRIVPQTAHETASLVSISRKLSLCRVPHLVH